MSAGRPWRARAYIAGVGGTVGRVRAFGSEDSARRWVLDCRAFGLDGEWWRASELPGVEL